MYDLIQYENYKKLHQNNFNRCLHAISLLIIPYSLYLLLRKEYFKSLIYYVIFIHVIPWFVGHLIVEKNHAQVFAYGTTKINFKTVLFFTIFTPILRSIDAYYLLKS